MTRRNTIKATPRAKELFLNKLAETGIVNEAVKATNMHRGAWYAVRHRDPEFAAAWDLAKETAIDRLEQEAWRRAHDGVPEPVVYRGELAMTTDPITGEERPLTITKYSDRLLEFLLKGHRFKDRLEMSGPGDGPVQNEITVRFIKPDERRTP